MPIHITPGRDFRTIYLALLSGLLLSLPWAVPSLFFFIFIAWVPLLYLEKELRQRYNPYAVFNYALLSFLLWNILGTWWISQAQPVGAILIIIANSLVQAFVFWLVSRTRTILGVSILLPFMLIWMGYEYFHEIWDLAWPWLNLGNALATVPELIQWYEYTGARGGTLWIILANIAILKIFRTYRSTRRGEVVRVGAATLVLLLVPSVISYYLYANFEDEGEKAAVALVQPNLDPYTEKFDPLKQARHLDTFFTTADRLCDSQTGYLLGPETLIIDQIDENEPSVSPHFRRLLKFQKKYPNLNILVGVHSYKKGDREDLPPGSRYDTKQDFYYEAFNTALFLPHDSAPQFYHKTKLVPLFERMPFVQYLGFLGKFSLELGGYTGTYSNRRADLIFRVPGDSTSILPIVCFESIFGSYCSENLPREKGFIAMITNDGWWKNTPGYQHHFNFSPVRAIECRRDMVRVANTGISAFIDARGKVIARTPWWKPATLKGEIYLRQGQTFFSRHGDLLGRAAFFAGLCLIIYGWIRNRLALRKGHTAMN